LRAGRRGGGHGGGRGLLPRLCGRRGPVGVVTLVAIDGPAGAGKSTVARALADRLGFSYLNSGAMYRCVALLSLAAPNDEPSSLAQAARIELSERVLLDGRDVT